MNLVQSLQTNPNLNTFLRAVNTAGLGSLLSGPGRYTVFAPTNEAFTSSGLNLNRLTPNELQSVLLNHIASGIYTSQNLSQLNNRDIPSLGGTPISITTQNGRIRLNNMATISGQPIQASNGTIYTVNRVLVPESPFPIPMMGPEGPLRGAQPPGQFQPGQFQPGLNQPGQVQPGQVQPGRPNQGFPTIPFGPGIPINQIPGQRAPLPQPPVPSVGPSQLPRPPTGPSQPIPPIPTTGLPPIPGEFPPNGEFPPFGTTGPTSSPIGGTGPVRPPIGGIPTQGPGPLATSGFVWFIITIIVILLFLLFLKYAGIVI
jgi:hypothetical protein